MSILKDIPEQIELGNKIAEILKYKNNIIIDAPTGWGKTGLAYQIYKATGLRTLILNNSNVLLDQYIDLLESNLKNECISCKGANNYFCVKDVEKTCANATKCNKCVCYKAKMPGCEYYERRKKMEDFPLVISNYQLMFSLLDSGSKVPTFDLIICDECHNIEDIIVDYSSISISEDIVNELKAYNLKVEKIRSLTNEDLRNLEYYVDEMMLIVLSTNNSNYKSNFKSFFKTLKMLQSIISNIDDNEYDYGYKDYVNALVGKWDVYCMKSDEDKANYLYDSESEYLHKLVPLDIKNEFNRYMNSIGDKIVMMSATVINHKNMIKDLGLNENKTEYIELESKFNKEDRPIVSMPVAKIKIREEDFEKSEDFNNLIGAIVEILNTHQKEGESGFIYCNSYKLCNMIYNGIKDKVKFRILMNTNAKDTKVVLEKFLNLGKSNRLLISPSFSEGVNFGGEISSFQIIPKVPYLYLGSKRISTKTRMNPRWYTNKTIQNIIQVSGRSVRFVGDKAITYILDSDFPRCYNQYKEDYPKWFDEALIWGN